MVAKSEAIRSLTIIYGFFFVFMSGLLSGIPVIHPFLTDASRVILYVLVWGLSSAFLLIGFELVAWISAELENFAVLGLSMLSIFIPVVFILVLGTALVGDAYLFGRTIADIGLIVFMIVVIFYILAILKMAKRSRR